MKKISVVTVCYNCEDTIEKTILSVVKQTYSSIEYIIVDGLSSDRTVDVVRKHLKDKRIIFISEPDDGLYDAMNKAIDIASGDYIIFMNSGDIFASETVLSDIIEALDGNNELVYGNVIRLKHGGRVLEKYGNRYTPMFLLLQGRMICHQSIFTRCDIMKEYRFNTDFSITADYDFLTRVIQNKRKMKYVDITVSIVDNEEGISSTISNMDIMREQDDKSLKENFPMWYYAMVLPKGFIRGIRRIREKKYE